ncbi:MAG TPA: hypothetical protein VGI19_14205, partial [Candidatus Cybelea sp.]
MLSDTFHKRFWSEETFRHIKIQIAISNEDAVESKPVEFELLVPEDLVQDLSGDNWSPFERRVVDGATYYAWSDFGATAILSGPELIFGGPGGVTIPPEKRSRDTLGLNLKAYADSVTVLYRIDENAEP